MNLFNRFHSERYRINLQISLICLVTGFVVLEVVAVVISVINPLYAGVIIVGTFFILYSIRNIFFGLCTFVFLHFLALRSTEQIDPGEVFFGIFMFLFLIRWFYDKKIVRGERLLNDTMDYSLAMFFGLCLFSVIPAILFGNSLVKWFRELVPFLGYLFYYPIKDTVTSLRKIKILTMCFLLVVIISGLMNIVQYQQLLSQVRYFWEIQGSRQTPNEPFFLVTLVVSVAFFLHVKTLTQRVVSLGLVLFSGLALVLSFSRGYWIAALLSLFLIFLLVDRKKKLKILIYIPIVVVPVLIVGGIYLGDLKEFFYKVVLERFTSIFEWRHDISLANRLNEAEAVFSLSIMNPVIGYGLGSTYSFYNMIYGHTVRTWYTHNAFLYLFFKLGILGVISFLVFYINAIKSGYFNFKKPVNNLHLKSLNLGVLISLISMLPLSLTSPQFIQKNSILVITIGAALVTVINRHVKGNRD